MENPPVTMDVARKKRTEHQEQWETVVRDPSLRNLPYKVETNRRGQIVLNPHSNRHSKYERVLQKYLDAYAPEGEVYPKYALATSDGVKVADVVWTSPTREEEMDQTGDPSTLAPEVCVDVMSSSNTDADLLEKQSLYREIGAEEVWVVDSDGRIQFFAEDRLDQSQIAPECPAHT